MAEPLKATARRWLAQGRPARLVQVLRSRGSVPREAGTRMLVAADALAGTIGGGHLELQAITLARAALASSAPAHGAPDGSAINAAAPGGLVLAYSALAHSASAATQRQIALGPSLGQCCGGALTLGDAPLDAAALAAWPDEAPLFTLQLYGAGHVGRAIVQLLASLPCQVQWIDERAAEFPPLALPGHIQMLCVDAVDAEVASAPDSAFYLVLTHSHALDLVITEAVLRRGDFAYLGLIGSATKRARFLRRLAQRGIDAATLGRLTCPIGVAGIPGKAPEQIAVAVVAQLLQQAAAAPAASALAEPTRLEQLTAG